mgnify:FL=1|tara:strand:- start:32 stop:601 length:570 start_codon:yes stop_codon:yes gene_type:complete
MSKTTQSTFMKLYKTDVSKYQKKKGKFTYLSWADAWALLKKECPDARYGVTKAENGSPFFVTECGYFVDVWVEVDGISLSQIHPILDNRNQPINEPNAFNVNTSIQRALAKTIALHGLGLYIFAGEDLPEPDALTQEEATHLYRTAKPLGNDMYKDLKVKVENMEINAHNYEACIEKVEQMIKNKKGDK